MDWITHGQLTLGRKCLYASICDKFPPCDKFPLKPASEDDRFPLKPSENKQYSTEQMEALVVGIDLSIPPMKPSGIKVLLKWVGCNVKSPGYCLKVAMTPSQSRMILGLPAKIWLLKPWLFVEG